MQGMLFALAIVAGISLTVQIGANATLRGFLANNALSAAFASFLVGTLALAIYLIAGRVSWPARASLTAVPLWAWSGGILGAFYVATATLVGPRLGAAVFFSLVVLGQLAASLLLDHFGWLGFAQHPVSLLRMGGVVLLLAGVVLITR